MVDSSTDRALDDLDEDAVIKPAKALFEYFRKVEARQAAEDEARRQSLPAAVGVAA
jgi:hypothetical protein